MSDMARTSSSEPTLPDQPSAVSGHPFTRGQLALFAGGSGDHNAIHIDSDVAKAKGFGDVIVPRVLVMALLGKMQIGRAAWRGRGWQYEEIEGDAGSSKKKQAQKI